MIDDARDDAEGWSPVERALLESALDFYGAAEAVIDYSGREQPRLRCDVAGLQGVRDAMASLEERILTAHDDGLAPERIARIARLEHDMVALIVARGADGRRGAARA